MENNEVIDYLKKGKKLYRNHCMINNKLTEVERKIRDFYDPYYNNEIDFKAYREFFKNYYFENEDGMYIIKLIAYHNGGTSNYFEVIYDYISKKDPKNNSYNGRESLRNIIHIYTCNDFKIKKRKDKNF